MPDRYVTIEAVAGRPEAEFLRSYLSAHGIKCELSQEAVGHVYGLSVGMLANVAVRVPSRQVSRARELIHSHQARKRRMSQDS